ncbi:MAG: UDP-N-acetylmuramoyl-L-alanine--D-glutamate ligase [Candidatus Zixiibacteriota bacterium]
MTTKDRVKGRKIGIIGMARSGLAAAKLIKKLGGLPFVSDVKTEEQLSKEIALLKEQEISYETGGHTERLLKSDFVILSPGIPRQIPIIGQLDAAGIPIFSEIELASWFCRGKIIAITGSNGKTTTTSLTGEVLTSGGLNNIVCGNIGKPFAEVVLDIPADGFAVVEVSNFQLETIEEFAPHIAMILNLTPDHLDRYDGFDDYKKAKYRIAENQAPTDYLILNADDAVIDRNHIGTRAQKIYFSTARTLPTGVFQRGESLVGMVGGKETEIIDIKQIRIPGPHNLQNAAAASLAGLLLGLAPEKIAAALRSFPGVPHRLEDVGAVAGIKFINDSKATNVDSVCFALRSIKTPICLIAGGRDKGGSYQPIVDAGRGKIKEIILIGEAREKMFDALGRHFPVQFAASMEEAVKKAFEAASPGETVLLSPACSSFDMFENFEHRGETFKQIVHSLKNNHSASHRIGAK